MTYSDFPTDPKPGENGPVLVIRPRRVVIYGLIAAAAVIATMLVVVLLLETELEKQNFRWIDRIGLLGMGFVAGGFAMLGARPRLRADAAGVWVRNIMGEKFFPWQWIERIAFPQGAHWAQLILPDDETYPVMAVQSMDKHRAVASLTALREVFDKYAPAHNDDPEQEAAMRALRQAEIAAAASRPLGRLEEIDRKKAAEAHAHRKPPKK